MNFRNMPELTWRYGYGGVVTLMFLIAGAMLWRLYRRGWFE